MIKVEVTINQTLKKVWEYFTNPLHITNWYFAADTWHCPTAVNNLQIGENFNFKMEAKDGSFGFNFEGKYSEIIFQKKISYILADDRNVNITFEKNIDSVTITESFDPEKENTEELQKTGWQAILNNFKTYTEKN